MSKLLQDPSLMAMVGCQNGRIMAAKTPPRSDIKSIRSEQELKVDFDAQLVKVDS